MSVSIAEGRRQRGEEESCASLQSRLDRVLSSVNRLLTSLSDSMCEATSSAVALQTRVQGVTAMARLGGRSRSRTPPQNERAGSQPSRSASRSRSRTPPQNRRAENLRSQGASPPGSQCECPCHDSVQMVVLDEDCMSDALRVRCTCAHCGLTSNGKIQCGVYVTGAGAAYSLFLFGEVYCEECHPWDPWDDVHRDMSVRAFSSRDASAVFNCLSRHCRGCEKVLC